MKNYIVMEMQFTNDTATVVPFAFDDKGAAEDKYLYLRQVARQSAVLVHTVVWMDKVGNVIEKKSYTHPAPPAPEEEPANAE